MSYPAFPLKIYDRPLDRRFTRGDDDLINELGHRLKRSSSLTHLCTALAASMCLFGQVIKTCRGNVARGNSITFFALLILFRASSSSFLSVLIILILMSFTKIGSDLDQSLDLFGDLEAVDDLIPIQIIEGGGGVIQVVFLSSMTHILSHNPVSGSNH